MQQVEQQENNQFMSNEYHMIVFIGVYVRGRTFLYYDYAINVTQYWENFRWNYIEIRW